MLQLELEERAKAAGVTAHEKAGAGRTKAEYEQALSETFAAAGIACKHAVWLPERFKGWELNSGHRVDFVLDEQLVVLFNLSDELLPLRESELLACLRLSGLHEGLLMTFSEHEIKSSFKHVYYESALAMAG